MLIDCVSFLGIVDTHIISSFHHAALAGDVNVVVDMLRDGVPGDCCDEVGGKTLW